MEAGRLRSECRPAPSPPSRSRRGRPSPSSRERSPAVPESYRAFEGALGPLENAVALPPMDERNLYRAYRRTREAEGADAVDDVHRQIDDSHAIAPHALHHLDRQQHHI